ncbi:MAG: tol-pal system protein YbgF [Marinobacter sp.]|uniref:tol-pal system protein YbgF n=1 Tax=Marinobacter sp. TaxID=50741 RepID=UPI00349FD602
MRKFLMATVALSLSGCAVAQSSAPGSQSAQPEPRQQAGASQANAELFFMIEQLQGEVRRLQGELEEQRNQLNRLSNQSKERYIDLDQRLLNVSERLQAAPAPTDSSSADAPESNIQPITREYRQPTAFERESYQKIQTLIRDGNYDAAIDGIYSFISDYPEGDLTVNAYYWLGEVYLVKPQLEQAKQAFTIVATRFSDHRKAADAVYKLGVTFDRLNEKADAVRQMERVVSTYPASNAASLAKEYLDKR